MSFMIKKLRSLLGDQTFLEAYERTGGRGRGRRRGGMGLWSQAPVNRPSAISQR